MPLELRMDGGAASLVTAKGDSTSHDNVITLAAIGALAYICCDLLHELVGHGGACIATGGRPITFSTTHFQCFGGWQPLICAAGILINVMAGVCLWLALRWMRRVPVHARYFLWLCMADNLFSGWGQIVQSSMTNSGDWANALRGLPQPGYWKLGSILIGVLFYCLSVWITAAEMSEFVGRDSRARVWRLVLIPYFAAGLVACTAGAANSIVPLGQALSSAVNSTLGNWGFLALPLLSGRVRGLRGSLSSPTKLTRSLGWILTAVIIFAAFVAVIGPGVRLRGRG